MARTRAFVRTPARTVFSVLSDPRAYGQFVVGSKRIRRFEPGWPDVGSAFHHTIGIGPIILRDLTRVEEMEPDRRLVLRAQMRPIAVNRVTFELLDRGDRTEVTVEEHPLEGPASSIWNPAFDALMWLRNKEMLRRLRKIAEKRLERQRVADR